MTASQILFSFQGRISRQTFARYYFGIPLLVGFIIGFADALLEAQGELSNVLLVLFLLCYIWPIFALQAKRWHDRDKSALWILISFIPIIGAIWVLVELVFLPGTDGMNQYGADPEKTTLSTHSVSPSIVVSTQNNYPQRYELNMSSSTAAKLEESRQLKGKGLLTDAEYLELRQQILHAFQS